MEMKQILGVLEHGMQEVLGRVQEEVFRDVQASHGEGGADGDLLQGAPLDAPDVGQREDEQGAIGDDVGNGVADEKGVDVHVALGFDGEVP